MKTLEVIPAKPIAPGQDLWFSKIMWGLDLEFSNKFEAVLEHLLSEGFVLRPYSGLRSPLEQAVLWCQSRTPLEAELIIRRLNDEGATYLAKVVKRASLICHPGRWATNNLPGQSWHNFGLAVDVHVVSEDGRAVWGPKHSAYKLLADVARDHGLFPGYDLVRQDVVHVQLLRGTVRELRGPWHVIDQELEAKFPNDCG